MPEQSADPEVLACTWCRTNDKKIKDKILLSLWEFHKGYRYYFLNIPKTTQDKQDLEQTLFIWLIKAIKRFDPDQGTRFGKWLLSYYHGGYNEWRKHKLTISRKSAYTLGYVKSVKGKAVKLDTREKTVKMVSLDDTVSQDSKETWIDRMICHDKIYEHDFYNITEGCLDDHDLMHIRAEMLKKEVVTPFAHSNGFMTVDDLIYRTTGECEITHKKHFNKALNKIELHLYNDLTITGRQ